MTKYIAFKIFDSKLVSDENDFRMILKKQTDRDYTVVHEDYFEGIIKAHLKEDDRDPEYWDKLSKEIGKAETRDQD